MVSERELRLAVSRLSALAAADLEIIWSRVTDAVSAQEALADVLPALVDKYGEAAETVAAGWYERLREEVGAKGSFGAVMPRPGPTGGVELAMWGTTPLFRSQPDFAAARSLVAGGLTRRIFDRSRRVVIESSVVDPESRGWQRLAEPRACGFCRMLESRGGVYTKTTVNFGSHDNCECVATPAWKFQPNKVTPYKPSEREIPREDQVRAKAWMAENLPTA